MIKINSEIKKHQPNFWNNCIFHPTDAIEDSWGRRILDRMSEDKSIDTVRIYNMFEDMVYIDGNGEIAYDFRVNDLRLDYLVEKGFDVLIAYAFTPECVAENKKAVVSNSKKKTRYKGKMINTSMPISLDIWEDMCYAYTKHIVERYGVETVSKWHLHCWNEPDIPAFFLSDLPDDISLEERTEIRAHEYCKLYERFAKALCRVSEKLRFGGPALAHRLDFLDIFLKFVREKELRVDYIALHNYSNKSWKTLVDGGKFSVEDWIAEQNKYQEVIDRNGFSDTEIVVDEWGMAAQGFFNIEECPHYIARENEVFSSYYVKLIHEIIKNDIKMEKLMICLSGQHEMVTDFSGFRNFFTLNFIAKPIYSAYILGSRLYRGLSGYECENGKIFAVPTKSEDGKYAVLMTYTSDGFTGDLPEITEEIVFEENINCRKATVWCIDRENCNPYRMYERMGKPEMTDELVKELKAEGNVKPLCEFEVRDSIKLKFTANCVYLVEIQ